MVASKKASLRKDLRVAVNFPVRVTDLETGSCVDARAWDLSGSGLLLALAHDYAVGSLVELEMNVPGMTKALRLSGMVARVSPQGDGSEVRRYLVAIRFIQISTAMSRQIRRVVTQAVLEVGDLLREFPAFAGLTEFDLLTMSGICHSIHLDKGDILLRHGDEASALYLVVKGMLRLAPDDVEDHEIECQEIVGCGQIFGEVPALTGLPHDLTVKALDPTHLIAISSSGVGFLKRSHPETMLRLMEVFMRVTGLRVRRLTRRLYTPIRN